MGGAVYTEDLVAKQERKEKIYEMMRQATGEQFAKSSIRRTSTENHCLSGFDPPRHV